MNKKMYERIMGVRQEGKEESAWIGNNLRGRKTSFREAG